MCECVQCVCWCRVCVCGVSHFNKAVPPLREAYLLTLPHGEDEDGVGGADGGSLAHVVPQGAV